jgi:hypothetical protein
VGQGKPCPIDIQMIKYTMAQDEIYELEGYFERKYKKQILDQINNFELPNDWTPKQVIDYITYRIDRK